MAATVSVVIPCHNAAPYLRETFRSIAAQTVPVDEVVFVDDGSTDGSAEVARSAGVPVVIVEQPNRGVGAARNEGIRRASGDLIALLDADDVWHPDKIRKQVEYFDRHGDVGAAVTSVARFSNSTSEPIPFLSVDDAKMRASVPRDYLVRTWVNQSAVIFRAPVARATPYPTHTGDSEDMIHAVELRLSTPIGAVPETLAYYRQHPRQATQRSDHFIMSVETRIRWAADNWVRLNCSSPAEAMAPVLLQAAERTLEHYWRRETEQFKIQRDRLLAIWPSEVPIPGELLRFVLPKRVLQWRDRLLP